MPSQFHTIFDEVGPEHEVESDMEEEYEHLDEPIPEEDEEEDILSAGHMSDEGEDEEGYDDEKDEDEDEEHTSRYPATGNLNPPRIDIDIAHTT